MKQSRRGMIALTGGMFTAGVGRSIGAPQTRAERRTNRLSTRADWIAGRTDGTRITALGDLVLDDVVLFSDDFSWEAPEESEFDWTVRTPNESEIQTHPDEGYVSLETTSSDTLLELEQDNGFRYDTTQHPDWRFNVVESNAQPSVGGAWEFWFSEPPIGTEPWVLIDAGGGENVPNDQPHDDGCGGGFHTRRDQLLTHYTERGFSADRLLDAPRQYLSRYLTPSGIWSGGRRFASSNQCWDEFQHAPIDHSVPRKLSLELLGSAGQINGYVDGRLEADLRRDDGQHVLDSTDLVAGIRLHDRGDHDETGFLHRCSVQKVGLKQSTGSYTARLDTPEPVSYTNATVEASTTPKTDYDIRYGAVYDSGVETVSALEELPPTDELHVEIALRTTDETVTPRISEIALDYELVD